MSTEDQQFLTWLESHKNKIFINLVKRYNKNPLEMLKLRHYNEYLAFTTKTGKLLYG